MPAQNQRRRPSLAAEFGTPGMSEDWDKTLEEPAATTKPLRIGVYTNGKAETMRARHVLEHHRPLDIQDQTTGSGT